MTAVCPCVACLAVSITDFWSECCCNNQSELCCDAQSARQVQLSLVIVPSACCSSALGRAHADASFAPARPSVRDCALQAMAPGARASMAAHSRTRTSSSSTLALAFSPWPTQVRARRLRSAVCAVHHSNSSVHKADCWSVMDGIGSHCGHAASMCSCPTAVAVRLPSLYSSCSGHPCVSDTCIPSRQTPFAGPNTNGSQFFLCTVKV